MANTKSQIIDGLQRDIIKISNESEGFELNVKVLEEQRSTLASTITELTQKNNDLTSENIAADASLKESLKAIKELKLAIKLIAKYITI